jgi:hypothetical protein
MKFETTCRKFHSELESLRKRQVKAHAKAKHPDEVCRLGRLIWHTQNAINQTAVLSGMERTPKRLPLKRTR